MNYPASIFSADSIRFLETARMDWKAELSDLLSGAVDGERFLLGLRRLGSHFEPEAAALEGDMQSLLWRFLRMAQQHLTAIGWTAGMSDADLGLGDDDVGGVPAGVSGRDWADLFAVAVRTEAAARTEAA